MRRYQIVNLIFVFFFSTISFSQQNIQPEVVVQSGVTEMVRQAVYSRDSKYVVAAMGRLVKLWDSKTGYEIRSFSDQASPVYSVDISGDNKLIVSGGGFLGDYKAACMMLNQGHYCTEFLMGLRYQPLHSVQMENLLPQVIITASSILQR